MMRGDERSATDTLCCVLDDMLEVEAGPAKEEERCQDYSKQFIVASVAIAYHAATKGGDFCCATCGIAGVDDVTLKECDGCDLVRYCSDACQEEHKSQHKALCKERAAELLRDKILFRQPESSHLGDCPICCLPLPTEDGKSSLYPCCSKYICIGCTRANQLLQIQSCPFCRHPLPKTMEEADKMIMNRVAANDPVALHIFGMNHYSKGDYDGAIKYWTKAAEFGGAKAHYELFIIYINGKDVQKDEKKGLFHLEEAAILGHPEARCFLGAHEERSCRVERGRIHRAVKHWIIAANLGLDRSIKTLKECYKDGHVSKEDFAAALRAYQVAVNAMKSPQREVVEKADESKDEKCPCCLYGKLFPCNKKPT